MNLYTRNTLLLAMLLGSFFPLIAQQDTTEYLFRKARFSYVQFTFGYEPMYFSNAQTGKGFNVGLIGFVLNDKIALGFDVDGFGGNNTQTVQTYPTITSYVFVSLDIEPLIRPRKVLNFSFPIKIGYGGAQIYELNSSNFPVVRNPEFVIAQPNAMVWVNLFKPLSLGAGVGYRIPLGVSAHDFDAFSGLSAMAVLRFKLYTRELQQQMMQRQQQMMQQPRN